MTLVDRPGLDAGAPHGKGRKRCMLCGDVLIAGRDLKRFTAVSAATCRQAAVEIVVRPAPDIGTASG